MKKIEFFVSDEKLKKVDEIRKKEQFTRAELMRRALDYYIQCVAQIRPNVDIKTPPFIVLTEGGKSSI